MLEGKLSIPPISSYYDDEEVEEEIPEIEETKETEEEDDEDLDEGIKE